MFVLKTLDGLYYKERWSFTDQPKEAKGFATPSAARKKLEQLLGNNVANVEVVAVAGVVRKAAPKPENAGKGRGRKKAKVAKVSDYPDAVDA